jgi:hypothetical protein
MLSHWWSGLCAQLCALILLGAANHAKSEDDPFGVGDNAAAQSPADPAAAAAAALRNGEKSILNEEPPGNDGEKEGDFCRCIGESDSDAVERIEKALQAPLRSEGFDFTQTPLEEVVNLLQEEYGIPIQIDIPALEATGLDPQEGVTLSIHNVSLRSALRLMLKGSQLTYTIQDEVLMVTTPEQQEAALLTCVYDVRRIVSDTSPKSMDSLIDTIVSCVSSDTWAENGGGEAEVRVPEPGLLVISQTQAVHEEINGLLRAIRDMRSSDAAAPPVAASSAAEQVITRSYSLQIQHEGNSDKVGSQVRELIVQALPEQQWDGRLPDGQAVTLTVLPDRVVVRQTESVQEQVAELLRESGVALPIKQDEKSGSGRRGGRDAQGSVHSG